MNRKKYKKFPCFLFGFLFLFFSCRKEEDIQKISKPAMLVYMVADNNLSFFASKDINEMEAGLSSKNQGQLFVFVDKGINSKPFHPYLLKIKADTTEQVVSEIIATYPEKNTANFLMLKEVLQTVSKIALDSSLSLDYLILWSHGSAWLPKNYNLYLDSTIKGGASKAFALDEYDGINPNSQKFEMDIQEISQALQGFFFQVIAFDACFMGSIEVAYELKNTCSKMVLSVAEVSSTGFPYEPIVKNIFDSKDPAFLIANSYTNFYEAQKNDLKSYTICVLEQSALNNFSDLLNSLHQNKLIMPLDTTKLSHIQQYDRLQSAFFYDVKSLYDTILKNDLILKTQFENAWKQLMLYESHSEKILGTLSLKNANGLSTYAPKNNQKRYELHQFYKTLEWYSACQYNFFWSFD